MRPGKTFLGFFIFGVNQILIVMRSLALVLLFYVFLIVSSCSNSQNQETNFQEIMVDRVWLTKNQTQMYFSSTDGKEYFWMTFQKRNGKSYTPFSKAEGTPQNNPLPINNSVYREGWSGSSYFKFVKDTLILQDEKDIDGKHLSKFHLEIGPDTTIGILEYQTIRVTNQYHSSLWWSEKQNL